MRIGILTFHKAINYGAYLQAFSLSHKLQEQFPNDTVEIIDYIPPKGRKRKINVLLRSIKHHGVKGGFSELKRIRVFNSVQKYLPLSSKSFCREKLEKIYSYIDQRYDVLIIGSDAVFNWNQTKFPTAFIPNYSFSIPVYTYAASVHGLRFSSVESDKLKLCGDAFEKMECVGTRDNCSERFVKMCTEKAKIMHCCDPTFFIDKEDIYRRGFGVFEKIKNKYSFSLESKYIVVMALDNPTIEALYNRYKAEYKFISVYIRSSFSDFYIDDLDPFEWSVILKYASLVITSYFHGTLLSLVQQTPTVVMDYSEYCNELYEGKLKDLMVTRLNIPELYYEKKDVEVPGFVDKVSFFDITDNLLAGNYTDKIKDAVENERNVFLDFISLIKKRMQK